MLDFVARVFRSWLNVLLWIILIGCAIGGLISGIIGGFGSAVLGLIIGGFIGLITVILTGGLIANFLNMVDNIEQLRARMDYGNNSFTGGIPEETKCEKCGKLFASGYTSCPHCGASVGKSTSQTNLSNVSPSPISRIQEDKRCGKCGKSVDSKYLQCPHCGSSEFK